MTHIAPTPSVVELNFIAADVSAIALFVSEIADRVNAAIAGAASPVAERDAVRTYLATASNAAIREDLIAARGARSACVLSTLLNKDLATEYGKRRPGVVPSRAGNGHGSGNGNGNGTTTTQLELNF